MKKKAMELNDELRADQLALRRDTKHTEKTPAAVGAVKQTSR